MDEVKIFPLWLFNLLLCNVLPYAVEYLAGLCRSKKSWYCGNAAVDLQASLALGLSWHAVFRRCRTVCLWLLQRDAYLHSTGLSYHGFIQTPLMVRLLPHGNHDTANLQSKKPYWMSLQKHLVKELICEGASYQGL